MNIKNQVAIFSVSLVIALGFAIGMVSLSTQATIRNQHEDLVNQHSLTIARTISNQITNARKAYAQSLEPNEKSSGDSAAFQHLALELKSIDTENVSFKTVNEWNSDERDALTTRFEKEGWAYLQRALQTTSSPSAIPPFWKRDQLQDGTQVLRVMTPEIATSENCVACHNQLESSSPNPLQQHEDIPHELKLGDMMGAIVTTVPISTAQKWVGALQQTHSRSQLLYFVVILISGVLALLLSLFIGKRIGQPIREAAGFARSIAEGDLTRECKVEATAETAELIVAMNDMRSRLMEIIQSLTQNAETVGDATTRLSSINGDLEGVATDSKTQSSSVAAAINEMTATVTELARSAESCAAIAHEATSRARNSNKKVDDLGVSVLEIGEISDLIQDIAEQTNLLSLNATIEAARAGDAGSGFAVVATEVKKLANQTANATEKIRNRIEGIESSTREAVESIKAITESISNVNEVSRTIAAAAEQQTVATSQIARNVEQTAFAAENVSHKVERSKQAAQELTRQADALRHVVSNFDT